MTFEIKHAHVATGDNVGNGEVGKDEWNAPLDATMATARVLGRVTAGAGDVEELTAEQARTFLNVADGATANAGTVTSVALTVPTGLSVSGSPISTSGTFAVTYASGYQGYTTAEASKLAGIDEGAEVNTVTSVAGKTGAVTLAKADVGLGNADNTSDANKPISTATQNALDAKAGTAVATTSANGLMSSDDKTKMNGIEAGAQVNTVTSVAGKTGAVTLAKGDVGLGNVDNTSDANKPVSTATQTALNGKANSSHTHSAVDLTDVGAETISTSDPSGSPANGTKWFKV